MTIASLSSGFPRANAFQLTSEMAFGLFELVGEKQEESPAFRCRCFNVYFASGPATLRLWRPC
jgi:hypothetical protein